MLSIDEVILKFRNDPSQADLVRYAYFDEDIEAAAKRFQESEEFNEVMKFIREFCPHWQSVLDLGAGNGIASYAFAEYGAKVVYAVEPDGSNFVGRGAIEQIKGNRPIHLIDAFGEQIPLPDHCVDVVYVRQVLHHTRDLPQVLRECARILKPQGLFIACREHVVDDDEQLAEFLNAHPVHQYTGGENAYTLFQYEDAIKQSRLHLIKTLGVYDSVINAYPVLTRVEIASLPEKRLEGAFGNFGKLLSNVPGVNLAVRRIIRYRNRHPGRMFSFIAIKTT